jgi:hypothetical protein
MRAAGGVWRKAGTLLPACGVVVIAAAAWQTVAWRSTSPVAPEATRPLVQAADATQMGAAPGKPDRAAQQHAAPRSQAPTTASPGGIESLPTALRAYARSGERQMLFDDQGHARPAGSGLAAPPSAWFNLAQLLSSTRAHDVMRWLLEQTAHDATVALARFASACQEAGVDLPLSEVETERLTATIGAGTPPPDLFALADLAAQDRLPAALRNGLRSRMGSDPALAQQWASLMAQSADAGQAHQTALLADDEQVWRLAFAAPLQRGATVAREGALSALAARDGPRWLQDLLRFGSSGDMSLAADLAARWAETALVGPRMEQLAHLASAGAFAGDRAPLLRALLRHAQDQNAAAALATQMGIAWPMVP